MDTNKIISLLEVDMQPISGNEDSVGSDPVSSASSDFVGSTEINEGQAILQKESKNILAPVTRLINEGKNAAGVLAEVGSKISSLSQDAVTKGREIINTSIKKNKKTPAGRNNNNIGNIKKNIASVSPNAEEEVVDMMSGSTNVITKTLNRINEGFFRLLSSVFGGKGSRISKKLETVMFPNKNAEYNMRIPGTSMSIYTAFVLGAVGALVVGGSVKIIRKLTGSKKEKNKKEAVEFMEELAGTLYETSIAMYEFETGPLTESLQKGDIVATTSSLINGAKSASKEVVKFFDKEEKDDDESKVKKFFKNSKLVRGVLLGSVGFLLIGLGGTKAWSHYKLSKETIEEASKMGEKLSEPVTMEMILKINGSSKKGVNINVTSPDNGD